MKIIKGVLVAMKGKKIGNLRKLLKNTLTRGVAASTSSKPNNNDTCGLII
jgi:hypothetical protein